MTEEPSRTSALASRHKALGSGLEDWNGMGTAWTYNSDPNAEHDAVREVAGMFDMSPLKKVFVRGADAQAVLDHLTTRDMRRLEPDQAAYLCVLTDQGTIADDAIASNNGGDEWMIVQGPKALEILNAHCDVDLAALAYFHHTPAKLFGQACRISRTGYSGERGYEVFAAASVVGDIWDKLVEAGVMPCSFTVLDKVRIEAGLLFYGYDMTTDHTPWEVGLGFTLSGSKANFRGREAVMDAKGKETIRNICLDIDHSNMVNGGESLSLDGRTVGTVNSPGYSHRLKKSLALAHVSPDAAGEGTVLTLSGDGIETSATVVAMPVYDPKKSRTHA